MRVADAVIVGGGPAGSVTAMLLARAGYDVELLDRSDFPRPKACGDCISPGANAILARLGLWDSILELAPAQLNGWVLSAGGNIVFSTPFERSHVASQRSFALSREKFDLMLLNAARAAGARIRTGVRASGVVRAGDGTVTGVQTAEGLVRARLVVGADGLRSRVARSLNAFARTPGLKKASFTAHLRGVPDLTGMGEMHVRHGACLGIAAVENGPNPLCNVTLVVPAHRLGERGARANMRAGLRAFAERDLTNLLRDEDVILASGPFDWPARRIVFDGAALVGDAAGYYDPFTGQGIYQAMAGAELLAEHATEALKQPAVTASSLNHYRTRLHALVAPARRVQHAIEFVCARPRLANDVFGGLQRSPSIAGTLIAVTGDTRSARALLSPLLLTRLIAASTASFLG